MTITEALIELHQACASAVAVDREPMELYVPTPVYYALWDEMRSVERIGSIDDVLRRRTPPTSIVVRGIRVWPE